MPAPPRGLSQLATPFLGEPSRAIHRRALRSLLYSGPVEVRQPTCPVVIFYIPPDSARRLKLRTSSKSGMGEESLAEGGDPSAGSPTDTLFRLLPPHQAQVRPRMTPRRVPHRASPGPGSGGATGSVCKGRGRIHRALMTRGY